MSNGLLELSKKGISPAYISGYILGLASTLLVAVLTPLLTSNTTNYRGTNLLRHQFTNYALFNWTILIVLLSPIIVVLINFIIEKVFQTKIEIANANKFADSLVLFLGVFLGLLAIQFILVIEKVITINNWILFAASILLVAINLQFFYLIKHHERSNKS